MKEEFNKLYKDNKSERPDLICRSTDEGNKAIILEFKRPKVKIRMEHITQALGYQGIIKSHRPNISFETFVVGRTYDPDVLAAKEQLEKGGLYLWSFSEILQRTRAKFERILAILNI